MNIRHKKQKQQGAVSLITVILLMLIFIVITLGFLRLAINEQRQSIDSDLSTRAYYAAESGIEDARRILNQLVADDGEISSTEEPVLRGGECTPITATLSIPLDTEIVCQLIDLYPSDFTASLDINRPITIPLVPPKTISPTDVESVLIEWHENKDGGDGAAQYRDSANISLPQVDCWNSGPGCDLDGGSSTVPAMLRVNLFDHSAGPIDRQDIGNRLAYLSPANGDGSIDKNSFGGASGGNDSTRSPNTEADCNTSDEDAFKCRLTINDLGGKVNYLRITPIYRGTSIKITMFTNTGEVLEFSNTQAVIDVTARAGDVTRRVEARVPRGGLDLLPNEAITGAAQICKLIQIEGSGPARTGTDLCDYSP